MENLENRTGVVYHEQPVTGIFSITIDRQWFFVENIRNTKRNQFLWKMIWAIVVGTVGNNVRKSISVSVSSYQMVAGSFTRRIRRFRIVRRFFSEKSCFSQSTIDFIRRNMVEKIFSRFIRKSSVCMLWIQCPKFFTKIKKVSSPNYIGIDESIWVCDASVHMAFRSEMYHRVWIMFFKNFF